uniref:Rhodanese domain-containing protein n=1 Tax=Oreochromis aureus TaxID=47969 RepID=A0A668USI4_OREAU
MLSFVLSRSFCQVVTEANRRCYPAFGSIFRTFSTWSPKCDEASQDVVTYSELKTMLASHNIQLFDVRNPDEYQAGHIPQAVNVPLDNLEGSLQLSPELFEQRFEVKAPTKADDNIVFHCKSGSRSIRALGIAHQLGFSKARHFKGGYSEWVEQEGKLIK